jgi:hypothetical protein
MTEANVFFGHHCPACGTTIGAAVGFGPLRCPGCGGAMQAAPGGPATRTIANVSRKHCGTKIGMLISAGGEAKCPGCGQLL